MPPDMTTFRLAVDKALAGLPAFQRPTAEAILEIAYLTMAVDEHLRDEEIDAFSVIAAIMLGHKLDDNALRTWLDRFAEGEVDRESVQKRLEVSVASLGKDTAAKLAAYRVACLMAMSDMDAADREFEFDLDLIAALGITQDDADRIIEEVNIAVSPSEN